MASLRKENGVWYVDFRFKGKRYHRSTKTSDKKVAQRILDEVQGEIARGAFNIEDIEENNLTLEEFRKEYIETHCRIEKSAGTVLIDEKALLDLEDYVGSNTVLRMVPENIARSFRAHLINKTDKRGKKLSPWTVNMKMRALRTAFNWAIAGDRRYVSDNVFSKIKQLPVDNTIVRAITPEELLQIFEYAERDGERGVRFARYLRFLLLTGCRRTEATSLVWGDINFRDGMVTFGKTKTHEGRVVPINGELKSVLVEMLKDNLSGDMDARVFPYLKNYVTELFIKYKRKMGLPPRVKLHSFRHTAAMVMRMSGVEILDIRDVLGHKNLKTTEVYAKAFPALLRPATETISVDNMLKAGKKERDKKQNCCPLLTNQFLTISLHTDTGKQF